MVAKHTAWPAFAKATARQADRVSAVLVLLFSGFVMLEARTLPYWTAHAPGPGFLPFWLGVLLACAAIAMLVRGSAPSPSQAYIDRATAMRLAAIVGMTVGAAALALIVGLVLASAVFMGATLVYLRPGHTRANWTATLLTPLVVWLLFVRWLGVPLPAGPLGF